MQRLIPSISKRSAEFIFILGIQARHGAKLGSVHMELCALTKSIQLKVIHQLYLDPSLNKRSRNVCSERGTYIIVRRREKLMPRRWREDRSKLSKPGRHGDKSKEASTKRFRCEEQFNQICSCWIESEPSLIRMLCLS